MTNFKSIAGGALWSLIAASLFFTALEPVPVRIPLMPRGPDLSGREQHCPESDTDRLPAADRASRRPARGTIIAAMGWNERDGHRWA